MLRLWIVGRDRRTDQPTLARWATALSGEVEFIVLESQPTVLDLEEGAAIALVDCSADTVPASVLKEALAAFETSAADTLVSVDAQGEETLLLALYRGRYVYEYGWDISACRKRCYPFLLGIVPTTYSSVAHQRESETYRDRIGDRLLHPERVDPDKKHLISDDHQRVNRVLSLPFGRRVLDVGCSDGTVSFEIARRYGSEVVGVDIATSAIAEAMKKLDQPPSLQSVVHFAVGFAEELDFTDESFDTVSACEVLEHIGASQLALALKNLVRMLKPGGNMIVTVPNRYPASRYIRGGRDRWRWPAHHQFFSRVSLARLLGEYFHQVTFYPLYDEDEDATDSVYLICECRGKRVR